MTYNEFVEVFNNYCEVRLHYEAAKYKTAHDFAKHVGIDDATMSRLLKRGNKLRVMDTISKAIGEDVRNIDMSTGIDEIKRMRIAELEKELKELKEEY